MRRPRAHKQRLHNFLETLQYVKKQGLLREKTHSQSIAHCSKTEQTSSKQINAFKAVTFQSVSHCHTLVTNSKPFLIAIWRAKKLAWLYIVSSSIFLWYGILSKKVKCPKDNSSNRFCRFQRYPLHKGISHWSFLLRLTM